MMVLKRRKTTHEGGAREILNDRGSLRSLGLDRINRRFVWAYWLCPTGHQQIFNKFKIKVDKEVDGSDDENKELREQLFDLSCEGGLYPQLFSLDSAGNYEFLSTGTEIDNMGEMHETIVEMVKADKDFLEKNPSIKDITQVFKQWI